MLGRWTQGETVTTAYRGSVPRRELRFAPGSHDGPAFLAAVVLVFVVGSSAVVVAIAIFLLLLVVLVGRRFAFRRGGALEFLHPRFDLVHEADVLVVLHQLAGSFVVAADQRAGTQVHVAQVGQLQPGDVQQHGDGEERHGARHGEARLYHQRSGAGNSGPQALPPAG